MHGSGKAKKIPVVITSMRNNRYQSKDSASGTGQDVQIFRGQNK